MQRKPTLVDDIEGCNGVSQLAMCRGTYLVVALLNRFHKIVASCNSDFKINIFTRVLQYTPVYFLLKTLFCNSFLIVTCYLTLPALHACITKEDIASTLLHGEKEFSKLPKTISSLLVFRSELRDVN